MDIVPGRRREFGRDRCQIEWQPEGGSLLKSEDLKFRASDLAPIGGGGAGAVTSAPIPKGRKNVFKKIIYFSLLRQINTKILLRQAPLKYNHNALY